MNKRTPRSIPLMPDTGVAVKPSLSGFPPKWYYTLHADSAKVTRKKVEKLEEQLKRWENPAKRGPKTKSRASEAKVAKRLWDQGYTYGQIADWFSHNANDWHEPKTWEVLIKRHYPETKGTRRRKKRT